MQPQETGGFDWLHGLTGIGGGAIGTLMTWIWRAARIEPKIRADFQSDIKTAEEHLEAKIEDAERRGEVKVEEMIGQFRESFTGMRRKIDDVEKGSLLKDDFHRYRQEDRLAAEERRKENREDFRRLEAKIDQILGQRA
jgi:hypothetical protein